MATKRQYGYYLKGNNLAIVEVDLATTTQTINSEDYGKYKSPSAAITDGIEVQYSYSPIYNFQTQGKKNQDTHKFLGWGSNGTNLVLFAFGNGAVADLSSYFSDGDWIHISGSGRWSGLHQVDLGPFNGSDGHNTTILSHGILTLKTRCYVPASFMEITVDYATNNTANGTSTGRDVIIETFKDELFKRTDPHVFINLAASVANHGLFSLSSDDTVGQLTFNKKYSMDVNGDYTSAAPSIADDTNDVIAIYSAFYEEITVRERIEVLEDENFDLDLPRYLANAIVYYLKAKVFEDIMDIEKKEYFMREFKRQVEKFQSTRRVGTYRAIGFGMTR